MNRASRVLILEPHATGHHGPYLEWMVSALAEHGFDTTVVTLPHSMEHPSLRAISRIVQRANGRCVTVLPLAVSRGLRVKSDTAQLVERELFYWRLFRTWHHAVTKERPPNVVFLPYLDYCLYAIALLGSPFGACPWVGLAMRPSFHYREMGVLAPRPRFAGIKKALFLRLLRCPHLHCVLTIDEPLSQYIAKNDAAATKVMFFPEPADIAELPDRLESKRQLGVSQDRRLILVYGMITPRKGVPELLNALQHRDFPTDVDVLLAGTLSPEVREFLRRHDIVPLVTSGRVRLLDRFIESHEEPTLFAASDIVWLGYRGHYTASGVLVQAARAGRPVIACKEGIIGWQTSRHGLGCVTSPTDIDAVVRAVHYLLSDWEFERAPAKLGTSTANAQQLLVRALADTP